MWHNLSLDLMVSSSFIHAQALGQPPAVPHLSQAWVAQSSGDGEPGETGKETYLYEECHQAGGGSDSCLQAHIFDYGACRWPWGGEGFIVIDLGGGVQQCLCATAAMGLDWAQPFIRPQNRRQTNDTN